MKKLIISTLILLGLSFAANAMTDIAGPMGHSLGFSGRFPIVGGMGPGGGAGPTCAGVIDASAGCPLPMLGM